MQVGREISPRDLWSKEIGNAQNAQHLLPNSPLNRLQTDLFTAESAGQKRGANSEDNFKTKAAQAVFVLSA
jgi:hypothetical protein